MIDIREHGGIFGGGTVIKSEAGDIEVFRTQSVVTIPISNTEMSKLREVQAHVSGDIRVTFSLSSGTSSYVYGQIFINDVAVGILRTHSNSTQQSFFTEDFMVKKGDLIQVFARKTNTSGQQSVFAIAWNENPLYEALL